jgi:hypothetical protein
MNTWAEYGESTTEHVSGLGCLQEQNDFNKNIALSYAAYKVGSALCATGRLL